jgi:hypothetical protein
MSHTWKFLPLAALFALGAFMLLPGGPSHPTPVSAELDCGEDSGRIDVLIIDNDTDDPLEIAGSVVELDPDPYDGIGSPNFDDLGDDSDPADDEDQNEDPGEITLVNTCTDDGVDDQATFTARLVSLPDVAEDCDVDVDEVDGDFPAEDDNVTVVLEVDCDGVDLSPEPTATATTTVGPAATVNVSSSNNNLGCGATSIVTITVLDAGGQPVPAGTLVNIVADKGSVSPASGQTTADGSVFVFYTAPSETGGEATITAAAGSALGEATIDVNCNAEPTQAPPPTQDVGGIQPPNTGDGGLSGSSNSWHTYAGVALILSSVITTLAVIRPRA